MDFLSAWLPLCLENILECCNGNEDMCFAVRGCAMLTIRILIHLYYKGKNVTLIMIMSVQPKEYDPSVNR